VLADEPTGNLDAEAGADVLRLLRGLAEDGRAVVLVTHEAAAAGIADRVLRLEGGRLAAVSGNGAVAAGGSGATAGGSGATAGGNGAA
jgi:ABC-type lipoprotein export system ATPase subunit